MWVEGCGGGVSFVWVEGGGGGEGGVLGESIEQNQGRRGRGRTEEPKGQSKVEATKEAGGDHPNRAHNIYMDDQHRLRHTAPYNEQSTDKPAGRS